MPASKTPDRNPNNESSRSPLMFIVMGTIIVLAILVFLLLRGQGSGGGGNTQKGNSTSQVHDLPAPPGAFPPSERNTQAISPDGPGSARSLWT